MAARKRKHTNRAGKVCISLIAVVFVVVMSVQIVQTYHKDQAYAEKQAILEQQLTDEEERQAELKEYEAYTKTDAYVEEVAKSRLGLVYDSEIIFKEQK